MNILVKKIIYMLLISGLCLKWTQWMVIMNGWWWLLLLSLLLSAGFVEKVIGTCIEWIRSLSLL